MLILVRRWCTLNVPLSVGSAEPADSLSLGGREITPPKMLVAIFTLACGTASVAREHIRHARDVPAAEVPLSVGSLSNNITVGPFTLSLSPAQTLSLLALSDPSLDDGFAWVRGVASVAPGDATIRASRRARLSTTIGHIQTMF